MSSSLEVAIRHQLVAAHMRRGPVRDLAEGALVPKG